MQFKKDDRIIGVWFAEKPNGDNFMMTAKAGEKPGIFEFEYRFRYVKDDRIWDSDDKKSFYSGSTVNLKG